MSEEILEFWEYFPIQIEPELRDYIEHHISHMQKCCENGLYSSAYPHLHIVYMTFVYIQLLRIANEKKEIFQYSWIGFGAQEKEFLKNPTHPLSFSPINEKSVFRFFRLVGFDDGTITNLSSLINERNENHHANGTIICKSETDFDKKVDEYLRRMKNIVEKQNEFLDGIYQEIVSNFEMDYELTNDDVVLSFGSFSNFELQILTKNRNNKISEYIYKIYLGQDEDNN